MASKYSKLINVRNMLPEMIKDGMLFSVSEKIHGANMSLIFKPGEDTSLMSRNQKMTTKSSFFNMRVFIYDLIDELEWMVFEEFDDEEVQIFGEIFGDGVQRGIHYRKHQSFLAFDILVDGVYMGVDEKNSLFEKYDIDHAKELMRGTYNECLKYPNDFNSLQSDERDENMCEGVVITPVETHYWKLNRIVFKNKNAKWSSKQNKKIKVVKELTEDEQRQLSEILSYVNKNRVISVMSHETYTEIYRVIQASVHDVKEAYGKEMPRNLSKIMGAEVANIVREEFKK